MIDNIKEIRKLIDKLNLYTEKYNAGTPVCSDKDWDSMYFELIELEKKTGTIYPDSPTQKIHYQTLTSLPKVTHQYKPMLSLDKSKDPKEIEKFLFNDYHDWCAMFKMDGLSCRLTYLNGKLTKAETRGNGIEGEDITHNAFVISSIPQTIATDEKELLIDGEIICDLITFDKYFKDEFKNERNFASGAIRLLSSEESASRKLTFVAWDLVKGYEDIDFFFKRLEILDDLGFTTVPRIGDAETVNDAIDYLDKVNEHNLYPIDGYVFKFESVKYGESLGRTEHHWNNAIAFKFHDEEYETTLKYIDYDVSRNGVLTPVAVFDPIEIDGSTIERCSLFNLSVLEEKLGKPYVGQKIWISKRNQIIPYIERAEKYEK